MARGEVTGKKPVNAGRKKRPTLGGPPPAFAMVFTIAEFCRAHRIGETHYYELKKNGQGPDVMVAGRRRLISFEAAARWRKARETAATEAAE
jgi:hypothetical protein